ncbi:MAG: MTAP family purine nucleoside phosphorylase, partial [Candidatus Eremiobacteraeota bacterium]|nr:MTAP family purine nucleoside phosphorylase [Candidatus Eremiobacteraeota bacterium]
MIALITGSSFYRLEALTESQSRTFETPFGPAELVTGNLAGKAVVCWARHRPGHADLPNHINYRAAFSAFAELGVKAILATSVVGLLAPNLPLAKPILFDDLYFPDNRLPDGELCSIFRAGQPGRGHFIPTHIFSPALRTALSQAAERLDLDLETGGIYGHVYGPRLNTRIEIAALFGLGITAVSQTAGPEAVLAGELQIPYALVGFPIDYANGVSIPPTSLDELAANLKLSSEVLEGLLVETVAHLDPP